MKNLKRFVIYFVYFSTVSYLIIRGGQYFQYLKNLEPLKFSTGHHIWFWVLFPVFIGLLAALPQFILKNKKPGSWGFDWIIFLAVGLPTLYVSITPLVIPIFKNRWPFGIFIMFHTKFLPIFGLILGYVLLTAFEKVSPTSSKLSEDDGVPLQ
ncbi:MAG: hypothetical protein PHT79_09240 [Syntrophomonadaceae bacterium]|nr:hypothetical protein [Syntrophomonadaceae bacterium]MDD3889876.1 hypothetical protein [Syntrophomonadaceae bacterium]MDD4549925.1 hypothetical protein [Syntrophomonadaceae bacterium]